jgi:hypothetical protein
MTDLSNDTLQRVRAIEVQRMSKDQKIAFLRSRGWRRLRGNTWERSRDGFVAPFAAACQLQALADTEIMDA